jgi:hypothetical protein
VWPHSLVIGVGGVAISVASDDPTVIGRLRPWQIDADRDVVDYALELDPARPEGRRGVRPLARLLHGSCDLVRLRDTQELTTAFMRILATFSPGAGADHFRIGLMPIVHDGRVILIPPDHGGKISHRWYKSESIRPIYSMSSLVHVANLTVDLDAPLDSSDSASAESLPLLEWWLPSSNPSAEISPGHALAQALRLAHWDVDADVQHVLDNAARLVAHRPPALVPAAMHHVFEQLNPAQANAIRRQVSAQLLLALDQD